MQIKFTDFDTIKSQQTISLRQRKKYASSIEANYRTMNGYSSSPFLHFFYAEINSIHQSLFIICMQLTQQQSFLEQFFDYTQPQPLSSTFTEEEFRSNDMKITLQIATQSYLRMQSDPKTSLVSFSCKNYGKSCYQIFAYKKDSHYVLQTDFNKFTHAKSCQLKQQAYQYLKIYNLMKLKKNLIQNYMISLNLIHASPSEILTSISQQHQYFFEKHINYNPELRRKLRKRFDNIINIDIKKITKGGRGQLNFLENFYDIELKPRQSTLVQEKNIIEKAPALECKNKKSKLIKKSSKCKKQQSSKFTLPPKKTNIHKQNNHEIEKIPPNSCYQPSQQFESVQDPIYFPSQSQLPEIKQLNYSVYNYFGDAFTFFEEDRQIEQMETINDKLRAE